MSLPESLVTAHAAVELEAMLARGFTTVRDAGRLAGKCIGSPELRSAQVEPLPLSNNSS